MKPTNDYTKYLVKAKNVIRDVFKKDYYGLLALPEPEVSFLTPDQENYATGLYYISIGQKWQIHLKFGKLPKNYKEFENEVKVLTRHEIEHFETCPFDVLTHFRMIGAIHDANNEHPNSVEDDVIKQLAPSIANQVSDIMIDTKNYLKYPRETLKSEIDWIKKCSKDAFQDVSRNCKLMFLIKEELWNEDLELYESDKTVKAKVSHLVNEFKDGGIDNKKGFINKTESYTSAFLELYELDRLDFKKQQLLQGSFSSNMSSKDNNEGEDSIVIRDPDKIKDAIPQLAQETTLNEFLDILESAGIKQLSDEEKEVAWFEAQLVDEIPLIDNISKRSRNELSFPSTWKMGDPMEDMDLILTLQSSPKILPGITTKKWEKQYSDTAIDEKKDSDLLLVIDTSGSMGEITQKGSRLHEAVLASFGFVKYFENKKAEIALVNFSSARRIESWTNDYDSIKELLLFSWGQGTDFPIHDIIELVERKKDNLVIVIMTDGELNNWEQTFKLFNELLLLENKIFLFIMDNIPSMDKYLELKKYGGFVENSSTMEEIRNIVFSEIVG